MTLRLAFLFLDIVAALQYRRSSLGVVSFCQNVTYCDISYHNFRTYCDRHGYTLRFYDHAGVTSNYSERGFAWTKLKLVHDALKEFNFVFWMDADSLFMNMNQTLTSLQPRGSQQIAMSGDEHCQNINSGHFMMKSGIWSNQFLDDLWEVWPKPKGWMYEQASMLYLLTGKLPNCKVDATLCCNASLVAEYDHRAPKEMNVYLNDFKPGDFILHFAGVHVDRKHAVMNASAPQDDANASALFDRSLSMQKSSLRSLMKTYASLALSSAASSSLAGHATFKKAVER